MRHRARSDPQWAIRAQQDAGNENPGEYEPGEDSEMAHGREDRRGNAPKSMRRNLDSNAGGAAPQANECYLQRSGHHREGDASLQNPGNRPGSSSAPADERGD
jgi:hypothetical protein